MADVRTTFDSPAPHGDVDADVRVLNRHSLLTFRDDGALFVQAVRTFLRDAANDGVVHVVYVSSAMVYGAWSNNPVPLFENEPIRPVPECELVGALAAGESLVEQWRRADRNRTTTILRPASVVGFAQKSPWVTALAHAAGSEMATELAGAQFLDEDDLQSAIDLCARQRVDGVVNVAPDGFIPPERLRALAVRPLRLKFPPWMRSSIDAVRWNVERGPVPPGLREYVRHSWVVSNDRLKELGWTARLSNEEAYVEGTNGSLLDGLSARRRQELALGAAVVGVTTVFIFLRWFVRRMRG